MIFTAEQWAAANNRTLSLAVNQLAAIKQNFLAGHVGKATRPWFVVNFPALHPASETLIGFEIETGFTSVNAQTGFLSWLWDNTDYTTVDREGCSNYPTEITFPPMTMETLTGPASPIHAMFAYNETLAANMRLATTKVTASQDNGGNVGSHTNISTAAYRALDNDQRSYVVQYLTSFFTNLNAAKRFALYGRRPYISDVARARGGTGDGALRIEFKMFHTTTNVDQFNNYLKVSQRLAELIDYLCAYYSQQHGAGRPPSNSTVFNFLTQDLEGGSVIATSNAGQYAPSIVSAALSANAGRTFGAPIALAA